MTAKRVLAGPVAMLQESPRRLPVQKHLHTNSPKRTLESNSGYAVSAILLLPSRLEYPPIGWLFWQPAILVSSKPPLTADDFGHIAVSHRRVGGNALDLTARHVQRLHTLGPKLRDNLEIAYGLHAHEIGKCLKSRRFLGVRS